MKKLMFISILLITFINSFSQRIYLPGHYLDEAYKNNVINLTFSPHKLGLGLEYISKPIIEMIDPISLLASYDIGFYNESNEFARLSKINIGASIVIRNFNLNISPSYNHIKNSNVSIPEFTFELGLMTKINKTYVLISVDPILLEAKLGIGLGF